MVAGMKYVPAEAKATLQRGHWLLCLQACQGSPTQAHIFSMHLQDIPMHGRSEIVRR